MKKIILILLILITTNTFSQQIYFEGGKTLSSFDYKNSEGERLDNLQASSHSFMTIGYRNQVFTENLNISLGTSYAGYGAIGSDDFAGNYMEWDLNYLEMNMGLDYELFKISNLQFYIKGSSSVSFLLQGTQTLNNRIINLNNQEDFNKTTFDFRAGFGLLLPVSEAVTLYAQFMQGRNFSLKEGTANVSSRESLRIISKNISFGILVNLEEVRDQVWN